MEGRGARALFGSDMPDKNIESLLSAALQKVGGGREGGMVGQETKDMKGMVA